MSHRRLAWTLTCACLMLAGAPVRLHGQTAAQVVVVVNENSAESRQIGEYYAKVRKVPETNVLRIRTATEESVSRQIYAATIEAPIGVALTQAGMQDRILYLVLTKGIPLRIEGTTGQNGAVASVDSELALLYRRLTGVTVPVLGRVDNPFYAGNATGSESRPFSHRDFDIYLVTRLDGFTVRDVLALIDRGLKPAVEGRIVLDQQDRLVNRLGEDWLEAAAERLRGAGHADRVVLEPTVQPARDISPVLGYYSWGSVDPRNRVRATGMGFAPGAIAAMFVGTDARTFREPPAGWTPSASAIPSALFGGSSQSLTGDLIREGVTGAAGHVSEPYLQSAIRPEVLFPAYLGGANLAEAFYRAMPHLSWQTVVIGDPLCAPFRQSTLTAAEIDPDSDPVTTLPAYFSARRVAQAMRDASGASERAVALSIRGEALMARGDLAGARAALEEATELFPGIGSAQLQLAILAEQAGDHDAAIARYRAAIAADPKGVVALNNLAYRLGERNELKEALPLAEAAVKLAPESATVLDTLAWIQYQSGDVTAAVRTMANALKYSPNNAEIRLHAATIYAAAGARAVAQDNLREALRLRPALAETPEVADLRKRIEPQ